MMYPTHFHEGSCKTANRYALARREGTHREALDYDVKLIRSALDPMSLD